LYEALAVTVPIIQTVLWGDIKVDGYCPDCRKPSTFDRSSYGSKMTGYPDSHFVMMAQYGTIALRCARSDQHELQFYYLLSKCALQKIGQFPSFADIAIDESKDYRKFLDKTDINEFHKAVGLAAHGVGIGSYVYLRRIFERLISKRYNEYKAIESWSDEDFYKKRMAEKIEHMKDHLPEFLVKNAKLYSILSVGLHELKEGECLAFFPVLRQSTIWILEQDKKKQEELAQQQELEKAIAAFQPAAITKP